MDKNSMQPPFKVDHLDSFLKSSTSNEQYAFVMLMDREGILVTTNTTNTDYISHIISTYLDDIPKLRNRVPIEVYNQSRSIGANMIKGILDHIQHSNGILDPDKKRRFDDCDTESMTDDELNEFIDYKLKEKADKERLKVEAVQSKSQYSSAWLKHYRFCDNNVFESNSLDLISAVVSYFTLLDVNITRVSDNSTALPVFRLVTEDHVDIVKFRSDKNVNWDIIDFKEC